MDFKVGVEKSDFEKLRESQNYYVDKTELIYELVNDTDNEVTLFTRPRRFGKTLMMSMIENFFSIRKESARIFEGLAITEHEDFCKEWMNQYPVLFVSFKDVGAEDFGGAYEMLKTVIADVCKGISDISLGEKVNPFDVEVFNRLQAQTGTDADIQNSLKMIMRMMNAVYGKKVISLD